MLAGSQLKLSYDFISVPYSIRASAKGANPNSIDLEVMISNSHDYTVTVNKIEIEIPVGSNDARTLSEAANLPSPIPDLTRNWTFSSDGSTVTIKPARGASGEITGEAIIFTLKAIQVNETPSADVPITVTEYYTSNPKISDNLTYSLVKQEADFPVINFYADPVTLYDLDDTVTLYWKCSDQGANYSYRLRSEDLGWQQPKDCLTDGICYSCKDGDPDAKPPGGVQTPGIPASQGSFTFYLDIIQTAASGHRTVHATLKTKVRVKVPYIPDNYYLTPYFSGHLVMLHWLAYNAAKCTIKLDSTVIDDNAPVDTYKQGYLLVLPSEPGKYQPQVIAHAQSGPAISTHQFENVDIKLPQNIHVKDPTSIAITPDSKLALVATYPFTVSVLDIATLTVKNTLHFGTVGSSGLTIAITLDGKLALVLNMNDGNMSVIDIATLTVKPKTLHVGDVQIRNIAITPDGKLALVTTGAGIKGREGSVIVIDIATLTVKNTFAIGKIALSIAITPDGKLALVMTVDDMIEGTGSVSVIEIATLTVKNTLAVGKFPLSIAITPDGKLALALNMNDGNMSVIDIATLTVKNTLPIGGIAVSIAITPDGKLAFVATGDAIKGSVSVIDIPTLTVKPNTIRVGDFPTGIAFTPDGKHALVVNSNYNSVTII